MLPLNYELCSHCLRWSCSNSEHSSTLPRANSFTFQPAFKALNTWALYCLYCTSTSNNERINELNEWSFMWFHKYTFSSPCLVWTWALWLPFLLCLLRFTWGGNRERTSQGVILMPFKWKPHSAHYMKTPTQESVLCSWAVWPCSSSYFLSEKGSIK